MYRIHEIKLGLKESKERIPGEILNRLGKDACGSKITAYKIAKESLDARDKGDIKRVYSIDFEIEPDLTREYKGVDKTPDMTYKFVDRGSSPMLHRPMIAGFGPCGMFAALILSQMGYKPIVLERGKEIGERVADVKAFWENGALLEESNVQFGEGGAGTFSDGKLTTGTKDVRMRKVLEELVLAGAKEEILYQQKPHIGTDVLRSVVVNIRKKIIENGGEIRFSSKLTDIEISDGGLNAVWVNVHERIETENLVLAIGHSARDTFRKLYDTGIKMEQKPFSIGLRIEHPQSLINKAQYGSFADQGLGAADYKLSHHCSDGRGVYTFCMCPGGEVIVASSKEGYVVTNGMSQSGRDGKWANSGLLADVKVTDFESDHPLAGIAFQEKYEALAYVNGGGDYKAPKTTWGEFYKKTPSAQPVIDSIPAFAAEAIREAMPHMARRLRGFDDPKAILTAVESRSSSPVRILRDENLMASAAGVYPGGEGAGYAGGIISAAVDGIRIAEKIASSYKPD